MAIGQPYEVFARKKRRDPLVHIGAVRAASEELARVYAQSTYDEENWVEMVVVPRSAMVHVVEIEPLITPGAVAAGDAPAGSAPGGDSSEGSR